MCNLCGSDKYSILFKTYFGDISLEKRSYQITDNSTTVPIRIVRCNNCGLLYANPRPAVRKLITNYINMVDTCYVDEEVGRRLSAKAILSQLRKMKVKGRLLDIGCATGFLLDEARKDGWEVHGVELSSWAVDYIKNKLSIDTIFHGVLKNANYPGNYFDVVILKDAIEHLTDPKGILIEIRRILKPNGILCVNTPNIDSFVSKALKARWWGIKQAHLYYFSRKTLCRMLDISGFLPVRIRSHPRTFTTKYWIEKFRDYNETLYAILTFLFNRGVIKNRLFTANLGDQIEIYARKSRRLKYLRELEKEPFVGEKRQMKVTAVLPAYNAARTLRKTVEDIPRKYVNEIILVDDASRDGTVRVARSLGIKVFVHKTNKGYGATQKTCYAEALKNGADIVVMVHPDYQYDPTVIPQLIDPIRKAQADAVFGSRMMKGGALEGGMPLWKHNANISLTALENIVFGTFLTEYHSGFRAYSAKLLHTVKLDLNSDGFIFDTEIIAQIIAHNFKIEEVPIRTRYFDEASTITLWPSILYGFGILKTLLKYIIHTSTPCKFKQFL